MYLKTLTVLASLKPTDPATGQAVWLNACRGRWYGYLVAKRGGRLRTLNQHPLPLFPQKGKLFYKYIK